MPAVKNYFQYFPKVDFLGRQLVDLTKRATFLKDIKDDYRLVGFYKVKGGETPWGLAHDFYGSEEYDWIIFGLNDIVNPLFDWCLSQVELDKLIALKYPDETRWDIHHYVFEDRIYYEPVIFEQRWAAETEYRIGEIVIPTIVNAEEQASDENVLSLPAVPFRFKVVDILPSTPGMTVIEPWETEENPSLVLYLGDLVVPTPRNGYVYEVIAGDGQDLAGSTQPDESLWTEAITNEAAQDISLTESIIVRFAGPYIGETIGDSISGTDEPTWPGGFGDQVEDGSLVWENIGPYAHPESIFVTNQEHEEIENEKKRIIKVLRPRYLTAIVAEFDKTMRGVIRR